MKNLRYLGFIFLFPIVINVQLSSRDTTETNIKVMGGAGSYAYVNRGCEGQVLTKNRIPFRDLGYSIDHKFRSPVRVGFRGGHIWESRRFEGANFYLNPYLSFEWRRFGIGAGFFAAQKELYDPENWVEMGRTMPSWHLRVGHPKWYFSIHMLESVPLYSGGGYINLGFGGRPTRDASYWFGFGTKGPYDTWGLLVKTNFKLKGNWYMDLVGRLGTSEGISESALSLGLNYKLRIK